MRNDLDPAQLGALLQRVQHDPVWFLQHILGWEPTKAARAAGYKEPITPDQIRVAESVRDNPRTAVPAGHGVGKTKLMAGLTLWGLFCFPGTKIVTTAPGWFQVKNLLWREIQFAYNNARIPLGGALTQTQIDLGPDWFAVGLSTDEPTRFQGIHGKRVWVIFDEATGVQRDIWYAADSLVVGPDDRLVAIGNPTDPSARFKEVCDSAGWNVIRLDCNNHPNVVHDNPRIIPGAVTKQWIEYHLKEFGGPDSPMARAKIFGLFPEQGDDMLISLAWTEAAQQDWPEPALEEVPIALGCDVARYGTDETVIIPVYAGGILGKPIVHQGQNTTQTADELLAWHKRGVLKIAVDDGGVGGGVTDQLEAADVEVIAVNFGEAATDSEHFLNRRAEMYWGVREKLRLAELKLPPDVRLAAELTNTKYGYSKGRIKLEDKEEIRKRLRRSPDRGDAVVLAVWAAYGETEPKTGWWAAVKAGLAQQRQAKAEKATEAAS